MTPANLTEAPEPAKSYLFKISLSDIVRICGVLKNLFKRKTPIEIELTR